MISLFSKLKFASSLLFILLLSICINSQAHNENLSNAYVAIIIDDLGYRLNHDQRAIELPGLVTYAFLPYSPQSKILANQVHSQGKEVMLHLPMQSFEPVRIGPGALTMDMNREQFKISALKSILSIPHVSGVNNHMGSLITSQTTQMQWLMEELARTQLFFVDSRTTVATKAQKIAQQYRVANTQRNIFLDHVINEQAIEKQFDQLIQTARKNGTALAIGHPHSVTMSVLERRIPQLQSMGIQLIPVSKLIKKQQQGQQVKAPAIDSQRTLTQTRL
jgi:polysaccharide deacetylase 2 family uncharacterized protein YibQ